MNEILKLLKELLSPRIMINILLLALAGFFFKTIHDYPIKELFFDKWFLITVVVISAINIAHFLLASSSVSTSTQGQSMLFIAKNKWYLLALLGTVAGVLIFITFTSNLADRTPEGRYGIYIARLDGDSDRSIHSYLTNALETTLYSQAAGEDVRIEVRDLKRPIYKEQEDETNLHKEKQNLNAAVLMWGSVTRDRDKVILMLRHWAGSKVVRHPLVRLDLADNSYIEGVASNIWQTLAVMRAASLNSALNANEARPDEAINRLKEENEALRQKLEMATASSNPPQVAGSGAAVLIGIADYPFAGGDLRGPLNDIAEMQTVLQRRIPNLRFTTLTNEDATADRVKQMVISTARSLGQTEILIVHFSGHGTSIPNPNSRGNQDQKYLGCLAPYDVEKNVIVVKDLATDIFKIHPKSILLLDADNTGDASLPADLIKSGAVMTAAGINQHGFESEVGGKVMGAFTAALVQVLSSSSLSPPASIRTIFSKVQQLLRQRDQHPVLSEGQDSPWL